MQLPTSSHEGNSVYSLTQLNQCCPQRSAGEGEFNTLLTCLGIVPATTRGSGSPGGLTNHSAMAHEFLMNVLCLMMMDVLRVLLG